MEGRAVQAPSSATMSTVSFSFFFFFLSEDQINLCVIQISFRRPGIISSYVALVIQMVSYHGIIPA